MEHADPHSNLIRLSKIKLILSVLESLIADVAGPLLARAEDRGDKRYPGGIPTFARAEDSGIQGGQEVPSSGLGVYQSHVSTHVLSILPYAASCEGSGANKGGRVATLAELPETRAIPIR